MSPYYPDVYNILNAAFNNPNYTDSANQMLSSIMRNFLDNMYNGSNGSNIYWYTYYSNGSYYMPK